MGRVYRAEQQPLGRQVALKVLSIRDGDDDPDFRRRFLLEASICARLKHPNTVTIFDYGRTEDDVYYIAMELLEGRTLRKAIRAEAPFGIGRAVHIAMQIARSLREAHGLGVIHRDLKPGNIFLLPGDEDPDYVKVLDFGLVKVVKGAGEELTLTGQFMGSPKYMPPEQIRGQSVDARSDIYALGALIYEMACGHAPFERQAPMDTLLAHLNEPLPPMSTAAPEAPPVPALEEVARRCLEKAPMDRYASMEELIGALRSAAQLSEVALPAGSTTSRSLSSAAVERVMASMAPEGPLELEISAIDTSPPLAVRRRSAALIGLGLLVVAALGGSAAWMIGKAPPEADPQVKGIEVPVPPPKIDPQVLTAGTLSLRSKPLGARVVLGDQTLCPATPCETLVLPAALTVGSTQRLHFSLEGRKSKVVDLQIESASMVAQAVLAPVAKTPPRRPRRPRHPPKEGKNPPKGYKDNPY